MLRDEEHRYGVVHYGEVLRKGRENIYRLKVDIKIQH
jgi:hypothetical protein